MLKSTFKFGCGFFVVLFIIASFWYETQIQHMFPGFRADMVLAGFILIVGWVAALAMRNITIGIVAFIVSAMVPSFSHWIVAYWPY